MNQKISYFMSNWRQFDIKYDNFDVSSFDEFKKFLKLT